jgi:hypothetical protein|tara:strand:+ start:778 stop:1146 length:369 start_codon:yes stop_codon:yes gene_type:complete
LKPTSIKDNYLSANLQKTIEKQLKLFYFNAFKRRSKNLLTLELIKECYNDQINFFENYINDLLLKYDKGFEKNDILNDLFDLKKNEGCNKKILQTLIIYLKERYNNFDISSSELKLLLLFEE